MKRTLTAAAVLASSAGAVFAGTATAAETPELPSELPVANDLAPHVVQFADTMHSATKIVGNVVPAGETLPAQPLPQQPTGRSNTDPVGGLLGNALNGNGGGTQPGGNDPLSTVTGTLPVQNLPANPVGAVDPSALTGIAGNPVQSATPVQPTTPVQPATPVKPAAAPALPNIGANKGNELGGVDHLLQPANSVAPVGSVNSAKPDAAQITKTVSDNLGQGVAHGPLGGNIGL